MPAVLQQEYHPRNRSQGATATGHVGSGTREQGAAGKLDLDRIEELA
ncbi:MAG TPA: hypothetical protein VJX48_01935 [Xanthobacteraceae bacterium]|nr:hypothetical protein [Xanthobacteraceae bacterium]